jgi:adenylylsulfate kinase
MRGLRVSFSRNDHAAATMKQTRSGITIWFFGLPAAGKSTLAGRVVQDFPTFQLLDGDAVRQTVGNFNMDHNARLMHLCYMAHCCRLLNSNGLSAAAAFVTPLEQHRQRIREILPDVKFVWLKCSLAACAARDPKGLWKKAAAGNLPTLTGAGGEWEDPVQTDLIIQTDAMSVEEAFEQLKAHFNLG